MHPDCTQFATVRETGAPTLQPKCNRSDEIGSLETRRKDSNRSQIPVVEHKGLSPAGAFVGIYLVAPAALREIRAGHNLEQTWPTCRTANIS